MRTSAIEVTNGKRRGGCVSGKTMKLDPELEEKLSTFVTQAPESFESLLRERKRLEDDPINNMPPSLVGISHEEHIIPGPIGDITLSVFRNDSQDYLGKSPGVFWVHPGGMFVGSRFLSCDVALEWVRDVGAVCVTAEYRLAPEHPDPAPMEDCYAALTWMVENAVALSFDPSTLILAGGSAGGGLAAGLALLCRDRKGPSVAAQVLVCPMLDPSNNTASTFQPVLPGMWSRNANGYAWSCLLGPDYMQRDISIYAGPANGSDFLALPPTFIDVGEAELFRDECVAYASKLWAAGVSAELHVWPGAFHGFDMVLPDVPLSIIARRTRNSWVYRWLRQYRGIIARKQDKDEKMAS